MRKKNNGFCIKKVYSIFLIGKKGVLFFLLMGVLACHNEPQAPIEVRTAFYHWQTQLKLTPTEKDFIKKMNISQLYVKFFDIDWDANQAEPIPLALLEVDSSSFLPSKIIPTVFITNRSLLKLSADKVEGLAKRIYDLIMRLAKQFPDAQIPGIQMDCDWSGQTRDKYFQLLRALRQHSMPSRVELSATIRLHQLKHPNQTGVPPVDRGMLMFYNMGEVTKMDEPNSILNLSTALQYIPAKYKYPISLDLALPLFHWGVLFREGKMIKLINGLTEAALQDSSRFQRQDSTHYTIIKSTYLDAYYLYQGDQLRLESVHIDDLSAAVQLLKAYFPRKSFTLAYYHLDTPILKRFPHAVLSGLAEQFESDE